MVIGSAMSVNLKNRASLISLLDGPQSVDSLAGWYGSRFAPPHVTNTEGEELVVISARFIPSVDWSAAGAALKSTAPR